jgi:hypothetical protein
MALLTEGGLIPPWSINMALLAEGACPNLIALGRRPCRKPRGSAVEGLGASAMRELPNDLQ